MIKITVTQAAYKAIKTTFPPNSITAPTDANSATVALWLPPRIGDGLSALRQPNEDLSDVTLRVAQMEAGRPSKPMAPRTEPDQIEELVRILGDDAPTIHVAPRRKDHSRRKLTPGR